MYHGYMNYHKIYEDFIQSRKLMEKNLIVSEDYKERHHILPVCMGGQNNKSNLIYLSARDHYFAHCCLAKMYGGKMWSALWAMSSMTKREPSRKAFSKRKMYEICKREFAKNNSERLKKQWADGYKIVRGPWKHTEEHIHLLKERMKNFRHTEETIERMKNIKKKRKKKLLFINIETNEKFFGYPFEFQDYSGLSNSLVSCLVRGKINHAKKWVIEGTDTKTINGRLSTIYEFENIDGRKFKGTSFEFEKNDQSLTSCGVSRLLRGKLQSTRGWKVLKVVG